MWNMWATMLFALACLGLLNTGVTSAVFDITLCSGHFAYWDPQNQDVGFELPGVKGAKVCGTMRNPNGDYVIEFEVIKVVGVTKALMLGQTHDWNLKDEYNPKGVAKVSGSADLGCHCPWGTGNWRAACDAEGLTLTNKSTSPNGIVRYSSSNYCNIVEGTTAARGCPLSYYQTAYNARGKLTMTTRDLYRMTSDIDPYTIIQASVYNATTGALYVATNYTMTPGGTNTNFGAGNVFVVSQFAGEQLPNLEGEYIAFKDNNNKILQNMLRIPPNLVALGSTAVDRIGAFYTDRKGKIAYNEPAMRTNVKESLSISNCYGQDGRSGLQVGTIEAIKNDNGFLMMNTIEVAGSFIDEEENLRMEIEYSPTIILTVTLAGGTTAFDNLYGGGPCNSNTPVYTKIDCADYNQYFEKTICNVTYTITKSAVESVTVNNSFNMGYFLYTAPTGVMSLEVDTNLVVDGTIIICTSRAFWCDIPVCTTGKAAFVESTEDPIPDPDGNDDPVEPEDENAVTDTLPGNGLAYYWVILIVVCSLIAVIVAIIVIYCCCGPHIKLWFKSMGKWRMIKYYQSLKLSKDREMEAMKIKDEMESGNFSFDDEEGLLKKASKTPKKQNNSVVINSDDF